MGNYTREEILAFSPAQISAMGLRALDLKQVESEAVHLKHPEHEFTFQKLECKVSGHSVLHIPTNPCWRDCCGDRSQRGWKINVCRVPLRNPETYWQGFL